MRAADDAETRCDHSLKFSYGETIDIFATP